MKFSDILKPERIIADLKTDNKNEAINALIDVFESDPRVKDIEAVRNCVLEREKIMSTGVGHGFAIPHGKTNGLKDIIAGFAKMSEPLEFEALDGEPVSLIFLLVGKENMVSDHIKLLSRISRMMNKPEFRESLKQASSVEEIYNLFSDEENKYLEIK